MKEINFMTIGDTGFFPSVNYSVGQIKKYYPQANIFIYDWGFTPEERSILSGEKINIVPWGHMLKYRDGAVSIKSEKDFTLKKNWKFFLRKHILREREYVLSPKEKLEEYNRKEYLLCQKPYCILDCLKHIKENLIFLDGDAFLINNVDEVLNGKFEVGVTVRPKGEICIGKNGAECRVLNSGVIFFNTKRDVIEAFVRCWVAEMQKTKECLREQTSLTRIIARSISSIYDGVCDMGNIYINDGKIRKKITCKIFSGVEYNYNWIEKGFDMDKNRILHLKGKRHTDRMLNAVIKRIRSGEE